MGISNSSAGWRPGICTSTTRPSSPYEGQMIYETDTDLTYLYSGSAWTQISGSTAKGNSGLVYISSYTLNSDNAYNYDGIFTSTYDTYLITVTNFRGSSNGYCYIQTRSGSPASSDTGTNYVFSENFGAQAANEANFRICYAYNTTDRGNATFTVYEPYNSATGTAISGAWSTRNSTTGFASTMIQGQKQTQSSDTGLRFYASGAITMSGQITVYGYRK